MAADERDVHLATRGGNEPVCRAREALPRVTMHPDLVTCLSCRSMPQFDIRVEERARAAKKRAAPHG